MDPSKIPVGSVVKINLYLLLALILACLAYWAWPTTPRNWGFAVAALVAAAASVSAIWKAWNEILRVRNLIQEVGGFVAAHPAPKQNKLADDDVLRRAGMK